MDDLDLQVPAPGEPLTPAVHPRNQALVNAEIARRLEMNRAKLSRVQLWQLQREYNRLHRQLNRAGYNQLVETRQQLLEEYRGALLEYQTHPTPALKAAILEMKRTGSALNKRLHRLAPVQGRFVAVKQRLDAHHQILQIEREEKENKDAFFREAAVWESQIKAVFRQSPRLHHVTRDKQGREITRIPIIDHIFLKPDKVYFRIRTTHQSLIDRLTGMWHSAIPYGVDVKALVSDETVDNLTAACGRVVSVERSPRSKNIFYVISRLDAADGIPKLVRLAQVEDHYPVEKHALTPWAAGMGEDRKIVHLDFEVYPNILIGGAAGGGKSNMINALLCQLITMNSPEELRLYLIDNKGGVELSHFDDIPHLLDKPVIQVEGVLPALRVLRQIIEQRYVLFREHKAKKLVDYNRRVKTPVPRVIVVIDELASLLGLGELTTQIHGDLRVISSMGRAAGVHLVVSTQHPSVDVLPGWIKTNLSLRIASRMPNHTASQIIVDSITAAHLPEVAGRMVFRRGGFEMTLQTPHADDTAIAKAVAFARQYPAPAWQLNGEHGTPEIAPPAPVFGFEEYIRASIGLNGSLSARKLYDSGAKEFIGQNAINRLGEQVIERLLKQQRIEVDGLCYEIEKLNRGYKLRLLPEFLPAPEPAPTSEESNPEIEEKNQDDNEIQPEAEIQPEPGDPA